MAKSLNGMPKDIQNLQLSNKVPDDRELVGLINELGRLTKGVSAKAAFKNWLYRALPVEIESRRKNHSNLATN